MYQGFASRREAERAYLLAFALGSLRVLPPRDAPPNITLPTLANPTPEALMEAFASADDNFLGAEWHVVFKGKRPGVYPAWYVFSFFGQHLLASNEWHSIGILQLLR